MESKTRGLLNPDVNRSRVVRRGTGAAGTFTVDTRDGRTLKFGSRLEAEAAKRRAGGGTIR